MNRIGIIVAGLTLASGLSKANIVVLPDAIYTWGASGNPTLCQGSCAPGETVSGATPGGGELTTYSGAAEVFPGLPNPDNLPDPFAFARFSDGSGQGVSASANVEYYFEVVGPAGPNIPIDIQYSVSASFRTPGGITETNGAATASVGVYLGNINSPTQVFATAQCAFTDCDQSSSGVLHLNAAPNFVYLLNVGVDAFGRFDFDSGSASADPYLFIDPSFTGAGYSLVLSDGISNVPPGSPSSVPEPASFGMVGPVLLAVFGIRRRLTASA